MGQKGRRLIFRGFLLFLECCTRETCRERRLKKFCIFYVSRARRKKSVQNAGYGGGRFAPTKKRGETPRFLPFIENLLSGLPSARS
jgi:hypothetical protein